MIINPATGKPFGPEAVGAIKGELYLEVEALRVRNAGSAFSSDQVAFKCPYCKQRNNQNIRKHVAMAKADVAAFKCNRCRKLVYVKKPRAQRALIASPHVITN